MEKAHHRDPVEYNHIQIALPEAQTSCSRVILNEENTMKLLQMTEIFLRKGKDGTRTM
jgi:hypothetical protein